MHARAAHILLIFSALFWSANAVAGKLAVGHVSPMALTCARWGSACAILLVIGWPHLRRDWVQVRRQWPLLLLLGTTGFTVFNVALYIALNFTTAINVSIEQATVPLFILTFNFLLFRTRVGSIQIFGFLLCALGVILTATQGNPTHLLELDFNFGDVLMLAALPVHAGYTIALRYKPDIHWQSLMIAMTFGAFVTSLPCLAIEAALGSARAPDTTGWLIVAFSAIFPSILAQTFYIRGVELMGSNRAGLFLNLVPICGILLSVLILGESFYPYHMIAMALVLGGIWLAERQGTRSGRE